MIRAASPLPDELEALITRVIGCCISVHRALGPGLLESIYSRAVGVEFEAAGIPYERERLIPVEYLGQLLCHQRLDIVVAGRLVLELKSVEHLNPVHHAQILTYMRVLGLRIGLLVNFNTAVLRDGLKRIVL